MIIFQSEASECGLACLAMVASHHGHEIDLPALRRRFSVSLKGTTMKSIVLMAQKMGLSGRGLRLEPAQVKELKLPCILHWDMNHFVVLAAVQGDKVTILDPAKGRRRMGMAELAQHFTGVALELTPTSAFEKRKERTHLPLTSLWGRIAGMKTALAQALVLSVVLQLFVVASPFYMQIAVDEAVVKGDEELLWALAIGFGLFILIKLVAEWLRGRVLLVLGGLVNHQMVTNLFHHLLRLPLGWFEKRHIGDLVSRFGSTKPIRDLITNGLVAALVDGVMAIITLVMIFFYSVKLAIIVLVALALYVVLRLVSFHLLRQREEEVIAASAKEQSSFIESARAIQTIKVFGQESAREELWQNRYADTIMRTLGLGQLNLNFSSANGLIYGLENIVTIYIGATLAMENQITVGMLYAFMSYKGQFLDKATKLLETAIQYRMLDLHLDRIADIALSPREKGLEGGPEPLIPHVLQGGISLRGITYRYAETEPDVLCGIDLDVAPGEFIAITGASGGGKTTLLKVMLGLFPPAAGEICFDGVPADHIGPTALRAQMGVVMQDDQLLSGSLAENITFFDPAPDLPLMRQCAAIAGIDADIMAMPMNYNTLVGDMGAALSGGQRQRVLLARALYRRPRILFMDEGTSHLDVEKEREVNHHIAQLGITRITIAHRPETIAAAGRVLALVGGRLLPVQRPVTVAPVVPSGGIAAE
ncbi:MULTISPECIES: peptidase domain-containing ABC transporter [unclassified Azospirillum]|uniref:peptidase domain-containing ABC transporter n=1 Tax=unclassified Azospirillum TaxID=2630922 RepID=UPI000B745B33|nr:MULTISPECIES: peptidase domain-containing ABC transporter [unclassified Azospirillum]SNR90107.1 colicin V processing peptidase. Cysteine peptidase. MEROPS family C39 [Azospirillum sp. RU38E]SNS06127.1 colicin V processing peptidase. Cysteine peptidase. MEROPS family C39 [Azospirillum sp. RU37A]